MSQPIRGQGGHLVVPIGPKNTNFVEGVEIVILIKFCWIVFHRVKGQVENVSANQRPGRHSYFPNRPEKHNFCRGPWDHASCQVSLNHSVVQRRSRRCLSQSEARAAILIFFDRPKNTNLVENIEIFFPVKFRWIPFSGFRGEVENVSTNQRLGRPFCFSDQPQKTQTW